MIKDRAQKRLAAKFCAASGLVPFVEVKVISHTGLEESEVDITDLDVLGVALQSNAGPARIIFDCKTSKQSGINRALWAGGLKSLVRADRAFVIQKKEAPDTHKLVANTFGVHLHSEDSFERYAAAVAPGFIRDCTYLDDMTVWDQIGALSARANSSLDSVVRYTNVYSALEPSGAKGVRNGLSSLIKGSGELDPRKSLDRLLFSLFLSSFFISLSSAVVELKEVFQFSMQKDSFEQRLRYFIWEGKENYHNRKQLKAAIERSRGAEPTPFDLPEWSRFVELMRSLLDAPNFTLELPLLIKELAFRNFVDAKRPDVDRVLRASISSNNRVRQFVFMVATYLTHAAGIPRDFASQIEGDLNELSRGQVTSETDTPRLL